MSTASLIDAERNFLEYSSPPYSDNDGRQDVLIYMIGGNPGLIGYYQPFLSSLHNLLQSSPISQRARFSVCGYSLAGFEDGHVSGSPVGLLETITDTENQLYGHVESHQRSHTGSGKPLKVILMGHSVGAYILLELIQHHKQKVDSGNEDFDLIGGILLFPTITHIAKSPSGMVASTLLKIPYAALVGGAIVRSLFFLVPTAILYNIIKLVMRFPDHAARTTTNLIKSQTGIRQVLHLAKDEMDIINDDKWDTEVWGTAHSDITDEMDTARWNLIFYWGKNDRWVADHTRDHFIRDRSSRTSKESEDSKPSMLMDAKGIPHAFCIKHSEVVAAMASDWVGQIIGKHERASRS